MPQWAEESVEEVAAAARRRFGLPPPLTFVPEPAPAGPLRCRRYPPMNAPHSPWTNNRDPVTCPERKTRRAAFGRPQLGAYDAARAKATAALGSELADVMQVGRVPSQPQPDTSERIEHQIFTKLAGSPRIVCVVRKRAPDDQ